LVQLRPHHFLCILTYGGRGYTPEFVANMDAVVARVAAGEELLLVEGPDDICAPMMACQDHPDFHCLNESVIARDAAALRDLSAHFAKTGVSFELGNAIVLDGPAVARLREAFSAGNVRGACPRCEWFERCSGRAAGAFAGARLAFPT
jgi:hypothetical protein